MLTFQQYALDMWVRAVGEQRIDSLSSSSWRGPGAAGDIYCRKLSVLRPSTGCRDSPSRPWVSEELVRVRPASVWPVRSSKYEWRCHANLRERGARLSGDRTSSHILRFWSPRRRVLSLISPLHDV